MTSLALTKLDVLSAFDELPVCVRYRLRDGSETEHFPAHQSDFHHAEPVWETLPGWAQPLDEASTLDQLPREARDYVAYVSARWGCRSSCRRRRCPRPRARVTLALHGGGTSVIDAQSIVVPSPSRSSICRPARLEASTIT